MDFGKLVRDERNMRVLAVFEVKHAFPQAVAQKGSFLLNAARLKI